MSTWFWTTHQGVHDKVDPQELHGRERNVKAGERSNQRNGERHHVDRELKLDELTTESYTSTQQNVFCEY